MNRPIALDDTSGTAGRACAPQAADEDSLLDEAVRDYLAREDGRADFLAEAEQSWQDYQADELHLSGEEARAWLRSWGSPGEKAPPYA